LCRARHNRILATTKRLRLKREVEGDVTRLAVNIAKSGAAVLALALASVAALAAFPERQITLVVPAATGGQTDAIARIVAAHMAKTLGQPIVVENVTGGGGTIAAARVAHAAGDGYTIMMGHMGTHGAAPALHRDLKYDPAKDFAPIGLTAVAPMLIVTRTGFPAENLKAFVEYAKKNQNNVKEAHAGVGSQSHTVCTLLQSIMGTSTARVPYRGLAPVVNDLVGGHVDFACGDIGSFIGQLRAGTIRALAVASPQRVGMINDVPTAAEGGLPKLQASSWNAIFAPNALPKEVQAKLNTAVVEALDDDVTRKQLVNIGSVVPERADRTPQALQMLVESEVVRWSSVLKAAGVAAN
jgi:tripartite-type tricarboxylate transporter receptor subunit TctC